MPRATLTSPDGPVVVSEKTCRALIDIRRDKLLPEVFAPKPLVMVRTNADALADRFTPHPPDWLTILDDPAHVVLPERCGTATPSEAATLRLAIALPASVVLIENPIKERAKLSFIKCEGTVSILVSAYRLGLLSAVKPMVKALRALGHEDVLPDDAMLEALWTALDKLDV